MHLGCFFSLPIPSSHNSFFISHRDDVEVFYARSHAFHCGSRRLPLLEIYANVACLVVALFIALTVFSSSLLILCTLPRTNTSISKFYYATADKLFDIFTSLSDDVLFT